MSKPQDYEFISASTDAVQQEVEAMYTAITGKDPLPSSPEKLFIQWVTSVLVQAYVNINIAGNQNIPSRASGENLDALGELFYDSTRPAAQAATVTMRFTISEAQESALVIPAGTRVTAPGGSVYFSTIEDVAVEIGDTTADARCVCSQTGAAGNGFPAGMITTCVDPFPYYSSCVNLDDSAGGTDAATDEEYYELMVASENAYSVAGPRGAYEYWAKSVSTDIRSVLVVSPEPGEVNIYVLMNDGTPAGSEIKAAVLAACTADEVRPLTDLVTVEDPETVSYDITLTYYISRESAGSSASIVAAIEQAVQDYVSWQCARIGRDLNPSKLTQMLVEAGAKRVVITSPTYTVLDDGGTPEDPNTPQLAAVGTITLTNGGYEDE